MVRAIQPYSQYIFVLLFGFFLTYLDSSTSLPLLVILILVLGLPHGLLDPWIFDREIIKHRRRLKYFLSMYLCMSLTAFLMWFWQPQLSLVVFLLVSSWHFGQDIYPNPLSINSYTTLLYGASIIAWPFFWHIESSLAIVNSLYVDMQISRAQILALMVISLSAILWYFKPPANEDKLEWPLLGFLALIVNPFEYFALYFCCLHSTRHYKSYSKIWLAQIKTAAYPLLALWIISLMIFSILVIGTIYDGSEISSGLISSIFWLLASLTVPHMWIIHRALARQKA